MERLIVKWILQFRFLRLLVGASFDCCLSAALDFSAGRFGGLADAVCLGTYSGGGLHFADRR
jgi:hypothetical protein